MQKSSLVALAREQLVAARAASSGRSAKTVYGGHEHALRQTVIALKGGCSLGEHANPGEATVHVLVGRVRLSAPHATWEGSAGDLIVVPDCPHALEAAEDSAVLLTVAKTGHVALVKDLHDRADVERLVRVFYERAFQDDLLRHVFVDVVRMDLEAHIPLITSFWERVLLLTGDYSGRTMEVHRRVHAKVPLTEAHFTRWVELWCSSVSELYDGPVAEAAQSHAYRIAKVFLRNLSETPARHALPIVPRGA